MNISGFSVWEARGDKAVYGSPEEGPGSSPPNPTNLLLWI